jgi:hypothetical protein
LEHKFGHRRIKGREFSMKEMGDMWLKDQVIATMIAKVGRCGLTVSNPELKARLVSALETKM